MCEYQASGPSHILVLTKGDFGETIIEEWQEVIGPPDVSEAQTAAATRSDKFAAVRFEVTKLLTM